MLYKISLEDGPTNLTEQAKHNAEDKFQRVLERTLGEPTDVLHLYRVWQAVIESDESELSTSDKTSAQKWAETVYKAQLAGLSELGECEAYFDIHIEK